jgi:hypothetical protein
MACIIDQTKNLDKEICWGRGDSDAKGFIIQDSAGVAVDITGFSFKLTVNLDKDPPDQVNEQFSIVGIIGIATDGAVSFAPTTSDTDIDPGIYFYDIEQTDVSSAIKTVIKGRARIIQDITKV